MGKKKTAKPPKKGKKPIRDKKSSSSPKKWSTKTVKADLKRRNILIPEELEETILSEIQKIKYITSTEIAKKYDIRISIAKQFLNLLEEKQIIKQYISSRRLKIYTSI